MLKMVDALEKSLAEDIQDLSWMSDETKKQAKVKLDAIRNKIGYPDVYRDYSSVVIKPTICWATSLAPMSLNRSASIAKIDKPLDRKRVGHDSADRERLLQRFVQRNRISSGHIAAAVLR